MKKILIVDDETQILKAMTRLFTDTEYETITSDNGTDALKLLETEKVDLIISDMKMPLMDGYGLLLKVKEMYPRIIRISLSGYTEENSMIKSYLHNIAALHIYKPWNNKELLQNIDRLFTTDAVLNSSGLHQLANGISSFPIIPENCQKMVSLIEQEDLNDLISEIEKDPEISELLLKAAKSAIYGATPSSVKQAAVYIGLHNLKCFLYWAAMSNKHNWPDWAENEMAVLWKQACCTNNLLLFLYEAFLHKQPPEASLFAGLLHNVGFTVLYRNHLLQGTSELKQSDINLKDLLALEMGEYQINHQELGAYLLNMWDLPFPAIEVALYHHRPLDPNIINTELVSCVHIAQHYAWKVVDGKINIELLPEAFHNIGITAKDFEEKLARYLKKGICI